MAFGFMANESVVAGIADFYDINKPIKLVGNGSVDAYSRAMPQACYLSQLDLGLTVTTGIVGCVRALVTWDATGDDQAFSETSSEKLLVGLTTGAKGMASIPVRTVVRAPSTQTALGEVYLWLKTDGATVTLNVARLHWAVRK